VRCPGFVCGAGASRWQRAGRRGSRGAGCVRVASVCDGVCVGPSLGPRRCVRALVVAPWQGGPVWCGVGLFRAASPACTGLRGMSSPPPHARTLSRRPAHPPSPVLQGPSGSAVPGGPDMTPTRFWFVFLQSCVFHPVSQHLSACMFSLKIPCRRVWVQTLCCDFECLVFDRNKYLMMMIGWPASHAISTSSCGHPCLGHHMHYYNRHRAARGRRKGARAPSAHRREVVRVGVHGANDAAARQGV
jgi:hypothetical protein